MQRTTLTASDGARIAARTFEPRGPAEGSVVIGGAMGVRQEFSLYENAPHQIHRIAPAELALRRIGHFGAFRSEQETRLWPRMADWLRSLAAPHPA